MPSRSRRSISRVMPERLSSTCSASSAIRSLPAGRLAAGAQHLVGGQRQAVAGLELGVELLDERGVDAHEPAPRRELDFAELGLARWHARRSRQQA